MTETQGDGKYYLSLRLGEIVTAVRAENTPNLRSAYDKIRIRRSIEYPVAGTAVALRKNAASSPSCASPSPVPTHAQCYSPEPPTCVADRSMSAS